MGQNTGVGSTVDQEQGEVSGTPQRASRIPSSGQTSSAGIGSTGGWIVWTRGFDLHEGWSLEPFNEYSRAKGFYDLAKRSGVECKLTLTYYETDDNYAQSF